MTDVLAQSTSANQRHRSMALLCGMMLLIPACDGQSDPPHGQVFVVGVEQLDGPAVPQPGVYEPAFRFTSGTAREALGFFLQVASANPTALRMRLRDPHGQSESYLLRLGAPQDPDLLRSDRAEWVLPAALAAWLADDRGVFWPVGAPVHGVQRLAVMLPASVMPRLRVLDIFDHVADDGTPLHRDSLIITPGFFYMAAIGDSTMWGNGLLERDKFRTLVAREIERRLGQVVISQVYAVSGARIIPSPDDGRCVGRCNGEVPKAIPAILDQIDFIHSPERMDLTLVNGCGNDVGFEHLLSPDTILEDLIGLTTLSCGADMLTVLRKIRRTMPQTTAVVNGYFPILSTLSRSAELEEWLGTFEDPLVQIEDVAGFIELLSANASTFFLESAARLADAVESMRQEQEAFDVGFAQAAFGAENATFGPDPWLWGLQGNLDLPILANFDLDIGLFPEDPLLTERLTACSQPGVFHGYLNCVYGSVAHPNVQGAAAIAAAIIEELERLGVIPPE